MVKYDPCIHSSFNHPKFVTINPKNIVYGRIIRLRNQCTTSSGREIAQKPSSDREIIAFEVESFVIKRRDYSFPIKKQCSTVNFLSHIRNMAKSTALSPLSGYLGSICVRIRRRSFQPIKLK